MAIREVMTVSSHFEADFYGYGMWPSQGPELEGAIIRRRDGEPAIGRYRYGVDPVGMAAEDAHFNGVWQVPDFEGVVL